jgi:hypothetical protein
VLLKLKWGPKSQQEEEEEVPNGDEVEEEDDLMICNWTLVPTHQRVTLHAPTGSSLLKGSSLRSSKFEKNSSFRKQNLTKFCPSVSTKRIKI